MKKIVSAILVCVLLVGTLFTLASCGKSLSGTYKDSLTGNITYEFGAFGKVTKTVDNIIGDDTVTEGKYEINDAGDKIILTFNDEVNTHNFSTGSENDVEYIKIDLFKYEKVK
jgi:hypothetical protein